MIGVAPIGGGGGGGGASAAISVPTLSEYTLALLALMLAGGAALQRRRH